MTAQIPDTVRYGRKRYDLAGINGTGLFDPSTEGMEPIAQCSACWRGHVCTYVVRGGRLLLDTFAVS